jgi:hypothetical protein
MVLCPHGPRARARLLGFLAQCSPVHVCVPVLCSHMRGLDSVCIVGLLSPAPALRVWFVALGWWLVVVLSSSLCAALRVYLVFVVLSKCVAARARPARNLRLGPAAVALSTAHHSHASPVLPACTRRKQHTHTHTSTHTSTHTHTHTHPHTHTHTRREHPRCLTAPTHRTSLFVCPFGVCFGAAATACTTTFDFAVLRV